jgi:hypothetical protein
MPTYIATFHTDANYAEHEFKAKSPKQALAAARALDEADDGSLYFTSYDDAPPVNEIIIRDDDGNDVAQWLGDELRLRLAAGDLLEALEEQTDAAQAVIDNWTKGDLAAAVRALDASIADARAAIAKAKLAK